MIPRTILSALLCAACVFAGPEEPDQEKLMAVDELLESADTNVDYNKACPEYKSYSTFKQYVSTGLALGNLLI